MFNRYTEIAITAMSQLAEAHGQHGGSMTAAQIAQGRPYSSAFIAKVLTVLSQKGLVTGTSGRRGGYALARPPETISLLDISRCFQRQDRSPLCPFGKGDCDPTTRCPLHEGLTALWQHQEGFLSGTHLGLFCRASATPLLGTDRPEE